MCCRFKWLVLGLEIIYYQWLLGLIFSILQNFATFVRSKLLLKLFSSMIHSFIGDIHLFASLLQSVILSGVRIISSSRTSLTREASLFKYLCPLFCTHSLFSAQRLLGLGKFCRDRRRRKRFSFAKNLFLWSVSIKCFDVRCHYNCVSSQLHLNSLNFQTHQLIPLATVLMLKHQHRWPKRKKRADSSLKSA